MKKSNGGQAMPQRYEGKYTDHISRNLVVAMENAGYTVEEFAAEAGVSDRTIRTHLKSSGSIKVSVLEKYAHILHIGVSDITSVHSKFGVTILRDIHQMRKATAGKAVPRYVSDEDGGIQENIISTMITLVLTHPISDSLADPTNKPFLIKRKGWHLISVTQRNIVKEQPHIYDKYYNDDDHL
jgi:transcriptional regulator with XRE-family HTH domain